MSQDSSSTHGAGEPEGRGVHTAGAFDIRTFIASLIGIYGVVLVITGLVQSNGRSINLTAGICMIIGAAGFFIWARLRPVVVPESVSDGSGSDRPTH